jgi:hypothetical protein
MSPEEWLASQSKQESNNMSPEAWLASQQAEAPKESVDLNQFMAEPLSTPTAAVGETPNFGQIGKAAMLRGAQMVPETMGLAQQAIPGQAVLSQISPIHQFVNKKLEQASSYFENKLQKIDLGERALGSAIAETMLPSGVMKGFGAIAGAVPTAEAKAAKIARESLGKNLPEARKILSEVVDKDITAAEALSVIDPKTNQVKLTAPTAQALLQRAEAKDPEFFVKMYGQQKADQLKQLQKIAGGANQTEARIAQENIKKITNEALVPVLNTEINSANIAGKLKPKLEAEATRMATAAQQKVEDVRRFEASKQRGVDLARQQLIEKGQPVGATRYTYLGGDLPKKAEEVSTQAANASLRFGEVAQFKQAANQSLEAHGLKPLTSDKIINAIHSKLTDPKITAGNEDIRKGLNQVKKEIKLWTNNDGVIDGWALEKIRQNSVNVVAQKLFANDPIAQKKFAGKVISQIRPIIIDAMEEAGGTGYRKYLEDYAAGSQQIAQTKAGAEAMKLFETSPKEFIKFVEGNSPETVENIFGAGNYDLAKQMSSNASDRLYQAGRFTKSEIERETQAQLGKNKLTDILRENKSKFKLPIAGLKGVTGDALLSALEKGIDKKTMEALTESAKSAKTFKDLLDGIPIKQRQQVNRALDNPLVKQAITRAATGVAVTSKTLPKGEE